MVTPPTFVSVASTAYNTNTTPKTLNVSVNAGDLIVVTAAAEDGQATLTLTATGLTWTKVQEVDVASYTLVQVWSATAASTTTYTLSLAESDGVFTGFFGMTATVWRDHGGVGASSKTNVSSGAPSLGITTTSDNSAIVVATADWNAGDGTSRTWRTANVSATETLYGRDSANYTRYAAYHTDAGTAGAKTVGLSAPTGQKYSIVALEVIGSTTSATTLSPGGIASAETFGTPALDVPTQLSPPGIASAGAIGTPVLNVPITASPTGIASAGAMGTPALSNLFTMSPTGIASAGAFGTPVLDVPITAAPTGIASALTFGAVSIGTGTVMSPGGIASAGAMGTPAISQTTTLSPTGIASAGTFGSPVLTVPITAAPTGIASAGAFGTPSVSQGLNLSPTGIPSAEALGTPALDVPTRMSPTGIASAGAMGTPAISGIRTMLPGPASTGEQMGTPSAIVDTWRQIIERDYWKAAITAHQRTVGMYVEMIDRDGGHVVDVPVIGGSIDYDGEAAEQWACSLTVRGRDWVARSPKDYLDPRSGYRCRIWWSLQINGGMVRIPVGTYYLDDPQITDDGSEPVTTIKGSDPLTLIRRNGYGSTVVAVGGLTIPDALARIFQVVAPDSPIQIESTSTVTLPAVYELTGNDPLDDLTNIAAQASLVIRTDREGKIVCSPEPDNQDIRADWQEGADCPIIDMERDVTTSMMVNSVTVVSTSPEVNPPISVTVEDDDPASPTYVEGVWGRRSITIRTDAVATQEGAYALAAATLQGRRRPTETITVEVPPRADLGFRDPVKLAREASNVADIYRVSSWRLPITGAADNPPTMQVTMMTRSTT